jgi:hypothetical protein
MARNDIGVHFAMRASRRMEGSDTRPAPQVAVFFGMRSRRIGVFFPMHRPHQFLEEPVHPPGAAIHRGLTRLCSNTRMLKPLHERRFHVVGTKEQAG